MGNDIVNGSDNVFIKVAISGSNLLIAYRPAGPCESAQTIFIAFGSGREIGASVLPFGRHQEGSTVFLPFKADLLLSAETRGDEIVVFIRRWERWRWSEREPTEAFGGTEQNSEFVFRIPRAFVGDAREINFVIYAKDRNANDGWGWFWGCSYDDDPAKVPGSDPVVSALNWGKGNVLFDLLNAGFDAVYDAPAYRALKRIYDGTGWANDIDHEIVDDFISQNSVRYAENHDEVRLAAASEWGDVGIDVGRPVSAILYGLSRGAIMLYNGQEVGEPAAGAEGFGGDDARTSIFDYWSMPELVKWVNEHHYDGARLSPQQKSLRSFYSRLINLVGEPAFRDGKFFPLNPANRDNPHFGRLPGEEASGHWLYAFLRYDPLSPQRFLVVANLHRFVPLNGVRVIMSDEIINTLELDSPECHLRLVDRLAETEGAPTSSSLAEARAPGILIPNLQPLTACYFEINLEVGKRH